MKNITDETLMAYVDDELDADARAAVETAMASNPDVARRVARQQELRGRMRAAFDGVLDEPVPERLITAARRAPAASSAAGVTDLGRARARKAERSARWSWPQWAAIAASLVVGVLVSQALWRQQSGGLIVTRDGRLLASDALVRTLSEQLAADQPIDPQIAIGLSFRSKNGEYCRTFVIREGRSLAGLACREGDAWAVQMVAPGGSSSATRDGGYVMAGAELPVLVLQAVEERIAGEPLDASGETAARESDWR